MFLSLGLALPHLLKPILNMDDFDDVLGMVYDKFILSVLFFFVITPIGFLARLCGKDF